MTNRTVMFCAVALSLALISVSMVPETATSHAAMPGMTAQQPMAIHSLTGVSFHSVTGF